jgi:hypothetical protein
MGRKDTLIVGTSGEHYVAFRLAQLGWIVALPRAGSPAVDLLVCNMDGSRTITIQVKTAEWAMRERGRGENRAPHHVEFPLGHKAAELKGARFIYAFVDLKGREPDSLPDVYIVPSKDVVAYCNGWAKEAKMVRWHAEIKSVAKYRNDWGHISRLLS